MLPLEEHNLSHILRNTDAHSLSFFMLSTHAGIRETTVESIGMIQKAGAPMVVAINKIDKPNSNPDKYSPSSIKYLSILRISGDVFGILR